MDGINEGRWVVTAETPAQWCAEFLIACEMQGLPALSPELTPAVLAELAELSGRSVDDPTFFEVSDGYAEGWCDGWLREVRRASLARIGADRPLLVGSLDDPHLAVVRELATQLNIPVTEFADAANRNDGLNATR